MLGISNILLQFANKENVLIATGNKASIIQLQLQIDSTT